MEHVCCREERLPVLVQLDVTSQDISVSSEDLFSFRIPYDELLIWVLHCVELIDVHLQSASASGITECYLAKTCDLSHDIWRIMMIDHIYLVSALVCVSQLLGWCKLRLEQLYANGSNDRLFHGSIL